jgi:hypothetical protein
MEPTPHEEQEEHLGTNGTGTAPPPAPQHPLRRASDQPVTREEGDRVYLTHQTFNKWAGALIGVLVIMAGGFATWMISAAKEAPESSLQTMNSRIDMVEKTTATQIEGVKVEIHGVLDEVKATRGDVSNLTQLMLTGRVQVAPARKP